MATSKIKIYKTVLTPSRNGLVESLPTYLASCTTTYTNDAFQYLKLDLDLKIKIPAPQDTIPNSSLGNYVSIEQDGKTWYYFIMKTNWKAANTVELELSIDSVNTFTNDFTFSDKTKIDRQHQAEWQKFTKFGSVRFTKETISGLEAGKEYYFTESFTAGTASSMQTLSNFNKIIFRRYDKNHKLLEEKEIDSIDIDAEGNLAVMTKSGDSYITYKSIQLADDYPILTPSSTEEEPIQGWWTFHYNSASGIIVLSDEFLKAIGGTVKVSPGYVRLIDPYSEELVYTQVKQSDIKLKQPGDIDWYLIYKTNTETDTTISCNCLPSKRINLGQSASETGITYTADDFEDGKFYYFTVYDNPNGQVTSSTIGTKILGTEYKVATKISTSGQDPVVSTGTIKLQGLVIYRKGKNLYAGWQYDTYAPSFRPVTTGWSVVTGYKTVPSMLNANLVETTSTATPTAPYTDYLDADYPIRWISSITFQNGNFFRVGDEFYDEPGPSIAFLEKRKNIYVGITQCRAFSELDRTDSTLVKIIKLPYAPFKYIYSNGNYQIEGNWEFTGQFLHLRNDDLSLELQSPIDTIDNNELPMFYIDSTGSLTNPTCLFGYGFENKLYHNDFTTYKLVYDSFTKVIPLNDFTYIGDYTENGDIDEFKINVNFKPSNTISSRFLFETGGFEDIENYTGLVFDEREDFNNYLLVDRNNEESIFTNDYINYMKTGYNYDKKKMINSEVTTGVTAGVSLAAGIAGLAMSGATGGLSAAAGVAMIASSINSVSSLISTYLQNERNMKQKLVELKRQSTSISNADDVNLMSYYSGNRLHLMTYTLREQDMKFLTKFFHICGYKHPLLEKPNTSSRYWFNYIQCTPVFDEEETTIYNYYIDDLKSRYQSGVTVYHYHEGVGDQGGWDFDQKYLNQDAWLIN